MKKICAILTCLVFAFCLMAPVAFAAEADKKPAKQTEQKADKKDGKKGGKKGKKDGKAESDLDS